MLSYEQDLISWAGVAGGTTRSRSPSTNRNTSTYNEIIERAPAYPKPWMDDVVDILCLAGKEDDWLQLEDTPLPTTPATQSLPSNPTLAERTRRSDSCPPALSVPDTDRPRWREFFTDYHEPTVVLSPNSQLLRKIRSVAGIASTSPCTAKVQPSCAMPHAAILASTYSAPQATQPVAKHQPTATHASTAPSALRTQSSDPGMPAACDASA